MEKLVEPCWLDDLLSGKIFKDKPYVILEATFTPENETKCIDTTCVKGAISIHASYFESGLDTEKYYPNWSTPEDGNLLADALLHEAIANLGINESTLVVVYDKGIYSPMSSCRVIWSLMYAGVQDVRLLNGGFHAWKKYNGSLSPQPRVPVSIEKFNSSGICARQFLATTTDVHNAIKNNNMGVVVDVRKRGEYDGTFATNYHFFTKSGHIPSCIYQGDWDELVDLKTHKLKDISVVKTKWKELGIIGNPGPIIFYCGGGWRSSISFFLAYMMGWETKNYDTGFYGWYVAGNKINTCQKRKHDL